MKTYHITTFGCQMNARDSEKLAGILEAMGYTCTDSEQADIVIINTCTVRENANERVYGHLGRLKNYKKKHPEMIIGLCGCMMQEPDEAEKIQKSYPFVNLVFGTFNIWKFPELIRMVQETGRQIIDIAETISEEADGMPVSRVYPWKSGVNIMYGCNNFCSYCIVPYVRGRERSRMPEEILKEIRDLALDGVKEVMLLGQNVNSYGRYFTKKISENCGENGTGEDRTVIYETGPEERVTFAQLLKMVCAIDGIERVRFMTSHPKDLSDELIEVMAQEPKVCHHLHLPLQSGSTRVLSRMNRRYTKESYLKLVDKIRAAIPDISITTDIIVGFPGERPEDFEETLDVVRKAGYESAFTFIYSPRTGTPAADMPDQVDPEEIRLRFDRLLKLVQDTAAQKAARFVGCDMSALIEEIDEKMPGYVTGRLSNNFVVHVPGDLSLIGSIRNVHLDEVRGFYYIGHLI